MLQQVPRAHKFSGHLKSSHADLFKYLNFKVYPPVPKQFQVVKWSNPSFLVRFGFGAYARWVRVPEFSIEH